MILLHSACSAHQLGDKNVLSFITELEQKLRLIRTFQTSLKRSNEDILLSLKMWTEVDMVGIILKS